MANPNNQRENGTPFSYSKTQYTIFFSLEWSLTTLEAFLRITKWQIRITKRKMEFPFSYSNSNNEKQKKRKVFVLLMRVYTCPGKWNFSYLHINDKHYVYFFFYKLCSILFTSLTAILCVTTSPYPQWTSRHSIAKNFPFSVEIWNSTAFL